jgi:hypothetical protein
MWQIAFFSRIAVFCAKCIFRFTDSASGVAPVRTDNKSAEEFLSQLTRDSRRENIGFLLLNIVPGALLIFFLTASYFFDVNTLLGWTLFWQANLCC